MHLWVYCSKRFNYLYSGKLFFIQNGCFFFILARQNNSSENFNVILKLYTIGVIHSIKLKPDPDCAKRFLRNACVRTSNLEGRIDCIFYFPLPPPPIESVVIVWFAWTILVTIREKSGYRTRFIQMIMANIDINVIIFFFSLLSDLLYRRYRRNIAW